MPRKKSTDAISAESVRRAILEMDRFGLLESQFGNNIADSKWGARFPGPRVPFINFRWEIDSTRVDLYVRDPHTGRLFKVRPTLYVVFDRRSSMPAGIHLDIHPPSALGFLAVIRNAILSKDYVKKIFPSIQCDWPLCGFPVEIFADNGSENWSIHVLAALAALQLGITYTPPYVPRYKAGVERFFGTLNTLLFHHLPGTTLGGPVITRRISTRDFNPQRDGRLDLYELAKLIHLVIIDEYQNMPYKKYGPTHRKIILSDLEWHDLEVPMNMEQFNLAMCRPAIRKVRQTGIHLRNHVYNSLELGELRAKLGAGQLVNVKVPLPRSGIYVVNPLTSDPFWVPNVAKEIEEQMPFAMLLPYSDSELSATERITDSDVDRDLQEDIDPETEAEEQQTAQFLEGARIAKREIITGARLREVTKEVISAQAVKASFSPTPALQDAVSSQKPQAPDAGEDEMVMRLRRKLATPNDKPKE